jgi:flagellar hook-length control protein FliK
LLATAELFNIDSAQLQVSADTDAAAETKVRAPGDEPEFRKVFAESIRQTEESERDRVKDEADARQASESADASQEHHAQSAEQADQEQSPPQGAASTEDAPPNEAGGEQPTDASRVSLRALARAALLAAGDTAQSAAPAAKTVMGTSASEAAEQDASQVRANPTPAQQAEQARARMAGSGAQQPAQQESSEGDGRGRATSGGMQASHEMQVPAEDADAQGKPGRPAVSLELPKSIGPRPLPDADSKPADRKPAEPKPDAPSTKPPTWPGPNEPASSSRLMAPREQPAAQAQAEPMPNLRLEDVVQVIRPNLQQGHSELRLQLHPPELGQLRIDVELRDNVLTLAMRAESAQVRDFLLSRLPELRHSLESHGINLERFHVEVRPPEQPQPGREQLTTDDQRSADRGQDGGRQTASHEQADSFESAAGTSTLEEASEAQVDDEPSTPATESSVDLVA